MKKIISILFSIGLFIISQNNVFAKDNVYSMNKYKEENFTKIIESYNDKKEKDGIIVGGYILKETIEKDNKDYKDYQIIIGKYNNQGKMLWKYTYGKTKEDYIKGLLYSYNENNEIDGYIFILDTTGNIEDQDALSTTFVKIDLNGKFVWEKISSLNEPKIINKMIPILKEDKTVDYYIAIGIINSNNIEKSVTIKYDRDFNIVWMRPSSEENVIYQDIVPIKIDSQINGFAIIEENSEKQSILIKQDLEGNTTSTILNIEEYESCSLEESNNGFLLYGITSEVKLSKGEKSYFIINYNQDGEENWESIGDIPINSAEKINLLPVRNNSQITKYLLEFTNKVDSNLEVIELDDEGTFEKKVKKINTDYYNIENFLGDNKTLYFIGQINCPKDDTCDYDSNSLFLISDEDKVIEVEDSDSKNILLVSSIIFIGIVGIVLIKRKKAN